MLSEKEEEKKTGRRQKGIKKIGCLTTTDFQKTNYLKTNLLKQIKKNIFVGLSLSVVDRYFLIFICCKITKKANNFKEILQKIASFISKLTKKEDNPQ